MLKLGRILDIDVAFHWSLLLLVGWTALTGPLGPGVASATLVIALFACVLAHEFGHSLAARQFGIETTAINLFPIGGVATLARMPREPRQELWIAIAGPLVNVAIASVLFLGKDSLLLVVGSELEAWLSYLIIANIWLVAFNLLPAFPMDGGRVLRATAASFLPYVQATNLAAGVGRVAAVCLAIVGFWLGHLMLVLIAGFVFFVGTAEARAVSEEFEDEYLVSGRSVGSRAIRAIRNGQDVVVVWDDQLRAYRACAS